MKVIKVHNGEQKTVEYPNRDIAMPVQGLKTGIEFYFINEGERLSIDSNTHKVVKSERLTTEINNQYPHLKNAYIDYEIVQLTNEQIVNNIDRSVGSHLDTNYPIWKRVKHADELREGTTIDRETYINSLKTWESDCRVLRDQKVNELINNNILPDFVWPEKQTEL